MVCLKWKVALVVVIESGMKCSWLTRASSTTTMNALNNLSLFKFCLWNSADAICTEVGVTSLNATETAEILIARFLPFCYQIPVSNLLFQTIVIQLSWYNFTSMEHVVDVARLLVMNLKDGPKGFVYSFSFMGLRFSWKLRESFKRLRIFKLFLLFTFTHLLFHALQCFFDQIPTIWRTFLASSHLWHCNILWSNWFRWFIW